MPGPRGRLRILACESGRPFAKKVLEKLKEKEEKYKDDELVVSKEEVFANSEVKTVINESIRGADIYVFQDVENSAGGRSDDENFRALTTAIDAAWRADADCITVVIPAFPYARITGRGNGPEESPGRLWESMLSFPCRRAREVGKRALPPSDTPW